VRYPFGSGRSYTTFDDLNMQVKHTEEEFTVSCEIKNSGNYDGAEIVQLYVKAPQGVFKPEKELKGFAKVYLKAGESKRVEIQVKKADLRYFNAAEEKWATEGGEYEIQLCSDCQTVNLSQTVVLAGDEVTSPYSEEVNTIYAQAELSRVDEKVFEEMSGLKIPAFTPKKPITLESRFTDLKQTFIGRILYRAVLGIASRDLKRAKRLPEGAERDNKIKGAIFLRRIFESNTIISMSMCAGNRFPYNFAQAFVHLANGHIFKGIGCFLKKIKAPRLAGKKQ
ncbi:MAG: fibronectin type III-like domain-contianing protein, partial [Clostridiales bacterium]|nr:fibronectin type III-like domain-contianing protein [Clostridiales bacterium]